MNEHSLPASTTLGSVSLAVRDIDTAMEFYRRMLGFDVIEKSDGTFKLAPPQAQASILNLEHHPKATRRPENVPGLFHAAYLYRTRMDLAHAFQRLIGNNVQFQGFADHGVSEAIYLADPEGNGLELYADRPRNEWRISPEGLEMVTKPLDVENLLAEIGKEASPSSTTSADLRLGHIHLQVSDLDAAESFWSAKVGFDVTQRNFPGALFVSAGGYHHHMGLNTWNSRRMKIPDGDITGLKRFSVVLPDAQSTLNIARRTGLMASNGTLPAADSDGIGVEFVTKEEV